MKRPKEFADTSISIVFTDIDGTLTESGRLPDSSYKALWDLHRVGYFVVPVTGRPAGWCELIARLWPVHGVVGENGAFYFRLENGKMRRRFVRDRKSRIQDRKALKEIAAEVRNKIPKSRIASDQFSRLFDLAIDFSEDVAPLSSKEIDAIVDVFKAHGAQAKVSNIHVNGWFGGYDKLSTCLKYLESEFHPAILPDQAVFVGDSPNDEPMFAHFRSTFAVANIEEFWGRLQHKPAYVARAPEAQGFCEIAEKLIALKSR